MLNRWNFLKTGFCEGITLGTPWDSWATKWDRPPRRLSAGRVGSVPRSKYSTYVRYCRWVRWVSSSSSKRDGGFETRPYVQAGEARTVVQPTGWGSQDGRSTHRLGKPGRSFNPRLGKSGRSFNPQAGEARTVVQLTGWGSQDGRSTHRLGKPGRSFNPRLGKPGRSFDPQAGEARTGRSTRRLGKPGRVVQPHRLGKPGLLFDLAQDRRVRAELARDLKCSALRGA